MRGTIGASCSSACARRARSACISSATERHGGCLVRRSHLGRTARTHGYRRRLADHRRNTWKALKRVSRAEHLPWWMTQSKRLAQPNSAGFVRFWGARSFQRLQTNLYERRVLAVRGPMWSAVVSTLDLLGRPLLPSQIHKFPNLYLAI